MKRVFVFLLLMVSVFSTQAQKKKAKPVDPKVYASTITTDDLSKHLYIVAGAEMQGRETATEGQRKAAAYIEEHFKSIGLKPGNNGTFQQSFPVYKDEPGSSEVVVNGKSFAANTDYIPFTQWNNNATGYYAEVVFVGHGLVDKEVDDYSGLNVTGKAVLLLDGAPTGFKPSTPGFRGSNSMYGKIINARNKGAAAVIIAGTGFPRKAVTNGGNMYMNLYKAEQYPNTFIVSDATAKSIAGEAWDQWVTAGKSAKVAGSVLKASVKLSYTKKTLELSSSNVLGYVEGSDKADEWLIVSAHYDHEGVKNGKIYYGADDDGSGTVSVLEMAEAFAKAKAEGKGPRRSVMFITVSGEEKGLWGSEYFSEHPTVPMEKTTADLNIDMIGRTDTERKSADTLNYVYVVGDDKLSTRPIFVYRPLLFKLVGRVRCLPANVGEVAKL